MTQADKIILPGGAGLVGQNLVARLRAKGYSNIVVLDKHRANLEVLRQVQPEVVAEYADLAEPGDWQRHFAGARVVVMLQAQIGGNDYGAFVRNNVDATRLVFVNGVLDAGASTPGHSAVVPFSAANAEQQALIALHELYWMTRTLRPVVLAGYLGAIAVLLGAELGELSRVLRGHDERMPHQWPSQLPAVY